MAGYGIGTAARDGRDGVRRRQPRRLDVSLPCHRPSGGRNYGHHPNSLKPLEPQERTMMLTRRILLTGAVGLLTIGGARAASVVVTLYKNPECGCCDGYADYLRQHGFTVTAKATNDLSEISRKAGVPPELQ